MLLLSPFLHPKHLCFLGMSMQAKEGQHKDAKIQKLHSHLPSPKVQAVWDPPVAGEAECHHRHVNSESWFVRPPPKRVWGPLCLGTRKSYCSGGIPGTHPSSMHQTSSGCPCRELLGRAWLSSMTCESTEGLAGMPGEHHEGSTGLSAPSFAGSMAWFLNSCHHLHTHTPSLWLWWFLVLPNCLALQLPPCLPSAVSEEQLMFASNSSFR